MQQNRFFNIYSYAKFSFKCFGSQSLRQCLLRIILVSWCLLPPHLIGLICVTRGYCRTKGVWLHRRHCRFCFAHSWFTCNGGSQLPYHDTDPQPALCENGQRPPGHSLTSLPVTEMSPLGSLSHKPRSTSRLQLHKRPWAKTTLPPAHRIPDAQKLWDNECLMFF